MTPQNSTRIRPNKTPKVASLVISSVMIQTAVAGHAVGIGVGPHFGGGGFGGGIFEMLFGGCGFHCLLDRSTHARER